MAIPRISRRLAIGLAVLGAVILVPAIAIGSAVYAYSDSYYPGVTVNGIALAGKSREEGISLVKAKTDKYPEHAFKVVVPDISKPIEGKDGQYENLTIETKASSLGLSVGVDQALEGAWKIGHEYVFKTWFDSVSRTILGQNAISVPLKSEESAIRDFVATQVVPKIGGPTPAKVDIINGEVSISDPKPGFEVDEAKMGDMLVAALPTSGDTDATYLKAPVSVANSSVTRESVQPIADAWGKYGDMNLDLSLGSTHYAPDRKELLTWLSPVQDDKGVISLAVQKDPVTKYLASKSAVDQGKSVTAVVDALSKLTAGSGPSAKLSVALVAKATGKVVPPDTYEAGKFEGKYIEVNLAQQKMYAIDGSNLVKSYVVSTGKWSTPTPVGTFYIHGKVTRAWSASYGLWMPYWQNFLNGEYGLHELPEWPNGYKEGQNHLGTPVSHGCVRLGVGDAKEIYNWTTDGTPVYIH